MAMSDFVSTVYAQNLEERVKVDVLKDTLRLLFSEFGSIVDIVAKKNVKARGQAFVVFDRRENAEIAIVEMQGFEIFGKPLKLSMARSRSDKSVMTTCSTDEYVAHVKHRQDERDKRRTRESLQEHSLLKRGGPNNSDSRVQRSSRTAGIKPTGVTLSTVVPDEYLPPNKILFLQNVPDQYDMETLSGVFSRFEGFREVRLVPGRKGIAFVEYDAEQGAIAAKESITGVTLGDKPIKVTFQRQ